MTRFLTVGGLVLAFSLGCSNFTGSGGEEQPASAIDQQVPGPDETPEDAADLLPEEGGEDVTCCCAYNEQGDDEVLHAEMLQTNCTSWGFECVDDAQCEEAEEAGTDEGETDAETAPAPAPSSTMTRSSGGSSMTRPGSDDEETTKRPGGSGKGALLKRPGSGDDGEEESTDSKMTRPR